MNAQPSCGIYDAWRVPMSTIGLSVTYSGDGTWDDSASAPADYVTTATASFSMSHSISSVRNRTLFASLGSGEFAVMNSGDMLGDPDPRHHCRSQVPELTFGFTPLTVVSYDIDWTYTYVAAEGYEGDVPDDESYTDTADFWIQFGIDYVAGSWVWTVTAEDKYFGALWYPDSASPYVSSPFGLDIFTLKYGGATNIPFSDTVTVNGQPEPLPDFLLSSFTGSLSYSASVS